MTYEIAYACENENMCEIKKVVIPIYTKTLERFKMSYYTIKPSVYREGECIVRNYTEDQARMDIWKEDMLQAKNGMYYTSQEIETWKVKNTQDMPTEYGNCGWCYRSGPIGTKCSQCEEKPLMVRGEAMVPVRPSYQLMQVKDMFLDSRLIAEIYRKGHDVTKADTWHSPEELVNKVSGMPFCEVYDRLDAERNGSYYDNGEDFSDIAAQMQSL